MPWIWDRFPVILGPCSKDLSVLYYVLYWDHLSLYEYGQLERTEIVIRSSPKNNLKNKITLLKNTDFFNLLLSNIFYSWLTCALSNFPGSSCADCFALDQFVKYHSAYHGNHRHQDLRHGRQETYLMYRIIMITMALIVILHLNTHLLVEIYVNFACQFVLYIARHTSESSRCLVPVFFLLWTCLSHWIINLLILAVKNHFWFKSWNVMYEPLQSWKYFLIPETGSRFKNIYFNWFIPANDFPYR